MLQISLDNATAARQLPVTPEPERANDEQELEFKPEKDLEQEPEHEYWTTAQAASILGKSERTIRRLLQTGVLDGYKYAAPNGMIWRVKPIENINSKVNQDVVNDLISEYQAKEEEIESLNQKIKVLEDQLSKTSALYEKAMHDLCESEKRAAVNREQTKQSDVKPGWWNVFKLPAALKTASVSDLI